MSAFMVGAMLGGSAFFGSGAWVAARGDAGAGMVFALAIPSLGFAALACAAAGVL